MIARMLALAVLRWPADFREGMLRDWQAEIHTITGPRRGWQRFRFAASLLLARDTRFGPALGLVPVSNWRYVTALAGSVVAAIVWALALPMRVGGSGDLGFTVTGQNAPWSFEWRLVTLTAMLFGLVIAALHRGLAARSLLVLILLAPAVDAVPLSILPYRQPIPMVLLSVGGVLVVWALMLAIDAVVDTRRDGRPILAGLTSAALVLGVVPLLHATQRSDSPSVSTALLSALPTVLLWVMAGVGWSSLVGWSWRTPFLAGLAAFLMSVIAHGAPPAGGAMMTGLAVVAVCPMAVAMVLTLRGGGLGTDRRQAAIILSIPVAMVVALPFLAVFRPAEIEPGFGSGVSFLPALLPHVIAAGIAAAWAVANPRPLGAVTVA